MLKELITYQCPSCGGEFGSLPELAGQERTCSYCKTAFTIPTGLTPRLVPVSDSPGIPLTPEEEAAVRREIEQRRAKPGLVAVFVRNLWNTLIQAFRVLRGNTHRF